MNSTIEQMFPEIGKAALNFADDLKGKLLLYAECEDGVVSADMFYVNDAGLIRFRFAPNPLKELVYSFWQRWKNTPGNHEWRTMSYVIDAGKFKIDLTYPEQINSDEDISERRPVA